MAADNAVPAIEVMFQRSLAAHLPPKEFAKIQGASVLVAGMGAGSNISELLVRKGVGRLLIADLDRYEPHNVRQRGSASSTWGHGKVETMHARLKDVNPHVNIVPIPEGITEGNVERLVQDVQVVVDVLDHSVLTERIALHRAARKHGKVILYVPTFVNGAGLYVFNPGGVSFEEFCGYTDGMQLPELLGRMLNRLVVRFPNEAPKEWYLAALRGERTIPLDGVGYDQAAILAVTAVENLLLGRLDRIVTVPRFIQVDLSDPTFLAQIVDCSKDFPGRAEFAGKVD